VDDPPLAAVPRAELRAPESSSGLDCGPRCGAVFAARCRLLTPLWMAFGSPGLGFGSVFEARYCDRRVWSLPRGSLRLLARPLRFTAMSTELWTLTRQAYLDRIRPVRPCPPPGGEMTSFAVIGLSAMIEHSRTAQRPRVADGAGAGTSIALARASSDGQPDHVGSAVPPGAVPPSAEGVAAFRGNLPGPSRRIVVEPIEVPAQPVQVPTEAPAEPAGRPEGEPAPTR